MSLAEQLINLDEEGLEQYKNEFWDIVQFFAPILPILKKLGDDLDARENDYILNRDQNNFWTVTGVIGNPTRLQEDPLIMRHLKEFKTHLQREWSELVSNFQWLKSDEEFALILVEKVFRRVLNGFSLEDALKHEWDLLIEIREPRIRQVKRVWLQNVTLPEKMILKFPEHTEQIVIENKEEAVSFKIELRLIRKEEFRPFCGRFFLRNPRIATCLEVIYPVPRLLLYSASNQIKYPRDYVNSINVLEQTREHLISSALRTLRFYTGTQVNAVHFNPEPFNYYIRYLLPLSYSLRPYPFTLDFFTDHCSITQNNFKAIKQIQSLLFKFRESQDIGELFNHVDRLDSVIVVDKFQTLVMIWSILERMAFRLKVKVRLRRFRSKGPLLCNYAARMSGIPLDVERQNELKFWKTINALRNKYIHGDSKEDFFQHLKIYLPNHNLRSVTLVAREKIFRILLFYLLLHASSTKINTQFEKWAMERHRRVPPNVSFEKRFQSWIRWKQPTELGLSEKYKTTSQLREIQL